MNKRQRKKDLRKWLGFKPHSRHKVMDYVIAGTAKHFLNEITFIKKLANFEGFEYHP